MLLNIAKSVITLAEGRLNKKLLITCCDSRETLLVFISEVCMLPNDVDNSNFLSDICILEAGVNE